MLIYKYAPTKLDEFELSTDLRDFFKMLIQSGNLNILLVGTRKTSLINALLSEYYCNVDINNSNNILRNKHVMYVNFIRDHGTTFYRQTLKTFCQSHFTMTNGLKKTIILDNLDCVSITNASCIQHICYNLIETYSNSVNFVISCTNIKKIMESIQSHSLIISVPPLSKEQQITILKNICVRENIAINSDVMEYLLTIENGNINVLINYLEKFKLLAEEIDLKTAKVLCTNISFDIFNQYMDRVLEYDLSTAMEIMASLTDLGYSVIDVLDTLFLFVKTNHCKLNTEQKYITFPLICEYIIYFSIIQENNDDLFFLLIE